MAEGNKGKGCLIGLLTVFGIIIVGIIIVVSILMFKGEDIVKGILERSKTMMPQLLAENHTDVEREAFLVAFSQFIDDVNALGVREVSQDYQVLIEDLQRILEDQRITRHESKQWAQTYNRLRRQ